MTLRHRARLTGADAGAVGSALRGAVAWDSLRDTPGAFGLPGDRTAWLAAAAERDDLRQRAAAIAAVARARGAAQVASYGVGTALLECHLVDLVELACTDFTPGTVERLQKFLLGADVTLHDIRSDTPLDADLHLMHRIDCELSNDEWRAVFGRFDVPVLFVPSELIRWNDAAKRLLRRGVDAGWARTQDAFVALWHATHTTERVSLAGQVGYLLWPRTGPSGRRRTS